MTNPKTTNLYCDHCHVETVHEIDWGSPQTRWEPEDPGSLVCTICGEENEQFTLGELAEEYAQEKADYEYDAYVDKKLEESRGSEHEPSR